MKVEGYFSLNRKVKSGYSGFERGSGCFKCTDCGKLTRQTTGNPELCKKCYEEAEQENWRYDHEGSVPQNKPKQ